MLSSALSEYYVIANRRSALGNNTEEISKPKESRKRSRGIKNGASNRSLCCAALLSKPEPQTESLIFVWREFLLEPMSRLSALACYCLAIF